MNKPALLSTIPMLFVLLALTPFALAQTTSPTPSSSGIEGSISVSPAMGGPTRQGATDAKPLSDTEFVVKQGDRVVASFRTDAQGHFRVPLSPGHYLIVRKDAKSAMGFYGPFEVEVSQAKMKTVQWKCDSGIR